MFKLLFSANYSIMLRIWHRGYKRYKPRRAGDFDMEDSLLHAYPKFYQPFYNFNRPIVREFR